MKDPLHYTQGSCITRLLQCCKIELSNIVYSQHKARACQKQTFHTRVLIQWLFLSSSISCPLLDCTCNFDLAPLDRWKNPYPKDVHQPLQIQQRFHSLTRKQQTFAAAVDLMMHFRCC